MKIEKNNYPQVYLEECKYRLKKKKMSEFIHAELKSDSDSEWLYFLLTIKSLTFFSIIIHESEHGSEYTKNTLK